MNFDLWMYRGLKIIGFGKAPSKDGAFFCPRFSFPAFPFFQTFISGSAVVPCNFAADFDVHHSAPSCSFNTISSESSRYGSWRLSTVS